MQHWLKRLVTLLAVPGALALAQDRPNQAKRYFDALRKFNAEENGTIFVAGKIMDGNGALLSDVSVYIKRSVASGWESKTVKDTTTVNREFDFAFRKNMSVILEFRKEGYHRRKLTFSHVTPKGSPKIEGNNHYYRGVEVVLVKIREIAQLQRYRFLLKTGVDGNVGLDLSGLEQGERPTLRSFAKHDRLPEGLLYSLSIPEKTKTAKLGHESQSPVAVGPVLEVRLSAGTEGGFIREPDADRTHAEMMVYMREAPAEDYEPKLPLTAHELEGLRSGRAVYFFAKFGKMYAKGRITLFVKHDTYCELYGGLLVQRDGSRNLETRH